MISLTVLLTVRFTIPLITDSSPPDRPTVLLIVPLTVPLTVRLTAPSSLVVVLWLWLQSLVLVFDLLCVLLLILTL